MAYYNDTKEFFNGALVLYKRNLSINSPKSKTHRTPKWYMRIKIEGTSGRAINKSTKHAVYEDAYAYAVKEYNRILNAYSLGHTLDEWTFAEHWDDWYERNVANKRWTDSRQTWHRNYYKRYFSEYFRRNDASMRLNEIDNTYAEGYWDWRLRYWETHEGKALQKYNPKRKAAKNKSTHNVSKTPANKTLQMEQSALNMIFYDARTRGRTQQDIRFKAPTNGATDSQRASFTEDEYNTLTRYLRSFRDNVGIFTAKRLNKWHALRRQQMYYFVLFLANSGLRVGEARKMTWGDVSFDIDNGEGERIAQVRVSQHTKKKKQRLVQTQPSANTYLKKWKELTPYKKQSDLVWYSTNKKGEVVEFIELNKTFQTILKNIPYNERNDGLLNDADGNRRSLYSLRHVYASMRLARDVSIYDLSLNMGTQVRQIELHYSHLMSQNRKVQITKNSPKPKQQVAAAESNDLVSKALQWLKDGKITEEDFEQIVEMKK